MKRPVRHLQVVLVALSLLVSCKSGRVAAAPVVPKGFDTSLLQVLACPEDLSKLRLATGTELEDVRAQAAKGSVRYRDGRTASAAFDGLLIRADARVGYAIKDGVADMIVNDGLALDPSVGRADPARYRR